MTCTPAGKSPWGQSPVATGGAGHKSGVCTGDGGASTKAVQLLHGQMERSKQSRTPEPCQGIFHQAKGTNPSRMSSLPRPQHKDSSRTVPSTARVSTATATSCWAPLPIRSSHVPQQERSGGDEEPRWPLEPGHMPRHTGAGPPCLRQDLATRLLKQLQFSWGRHLGCPGCLARGKELSKPSHPAGSPNSKN